MCECPGEWIADLVWLNLMLATIIKNYMYHGSCVMYISLCAIRSWNWNWKLTQDHFLIERWIQRTHRCSAVRCWPWGVFSSWLASRDLGTTRSSYLEWVGPVVRTASHIRAVARPPYGDLAMHLRCGCVVAVSEKSLMSVYKATTKKL